jgi:subtilisin family serine protease
MPERSDDWRDGLAPKVVNEIDYIIKAFDRASHGRIHIEVARSGNRVDYLYAAGQILVRDEYLDRVLHIIEFETPEDQRRQMWNDRDRVQRVIEGVVLLTLRKEGPQVQDALERVEERLGRGIATPDHVLTVAPGEGTPCPATEPEEVYEEIEPYPSVCLGNGGAGVLVYMDDTGLLAGADTAHSWLAGVTGDPDPLPPRNPPGTPTPPGIQPLERYTGHGTFVAGVLRCMAPGARIIVTDVFPVTTAGSQLESTWIPRLEAALGLGADIFHLTISAHTRHDHPLITFQKWLERLRSYGGAVCVVAAGNDGSRRLSWPAAFSEVVSVGALGSDWRGRASFSNFGPWVDVYAPGRDLINAYATGTYICKVHPYVNQPREFYGMAKWSGTSFSTPIVSGLIAARMTRAGETARQAAAALLAEARSHAIPGVGAILLPCCNDHDVCAKPLECRCRSHQHHPHDC